MSSSNAATEASVQSLMNRLLAALLGADAGDPDQTARDHVQWLSDCDRILDAAAGDRRLTTLLTTLRGFVEPKVLEWIGSGRCSDAFLAECRSAFPPVWGESGLSAAIPRALQAEAIRIFRGRSGSLRPFEDLILSFGEDHSKTRPRPDIELADKVCAEDGGPSRIDRRARPAAWGVERWGATAGKDADWQSLAIFRANPAVAFAIYTKPETSGA
jgi:hypothetical protein